MLLTRASDPPFVDHSTIPRVDITEMNTRARFSKSICTKHSLPQHFPIGYLLCNCSLHNCNLHSCDLHSCNLHNLRYRHWESEGLMFVPRILYSMYYSTYHFTAISGSADFHISEDFYVVSLFCIQFVIKLIMSLPDLDQPIFKLPNKHT